MTVAFLFSLIVGLTSEAHALVPKNGVILAANSLKDLLDEQDKESPYHRCVTQSLSARYFSNHCARLTELLRKKMNVMILESDLQMQAEKLAKEPLSSDAKSRISMLAKINLLAVQAEEVIKAAETRSENSDGKEALPDILPAVRKVQVSFLSYAKFLPRREK
ncbi:MAG: hypothetical protein H7333_06265 [Bdellovibrionales bacterium]|nr:hypothetical protein [Oligoflexia bacterium]